MRHATPGQPDVFESARVANDASPQRHLRVFRWYETDRTDFRFLVEDVWGHVVDEGLTDSTCSVLLQIVGALSQGYDVRITCSDGTVVDHRNRDRRGDWNEDFGPSSDQALRHLGGR